MTDEKFIETQHQGRLTMLKAATKGLDLMDAQKELLVFMSMQSETRAQALAGLILQCRSEGFKENEGI